MSKLNISNIAKGLQIVLKKHSPEILTGIGITGMITTTVMAVKATPRAIRLVEEQTRYNHDGMMKSPTKIETVKLVWKCYIPATITGVMSVVCLVGASSVNVRCNAALATAYTLSESTLKEYQEKVIETIGEKKERTITDAVAKDKLDQDPVTSREVVITEKGDTLCYDVISGRYFKSDIEKLKRAENELNREMMEDMYISLNDFYYSIGLNNISIGEDIGWKIDDGLIDLHFSSQLADDGTPCLVLNYHISPKYDYRY